MLCWALPIHSRTSQVGSGPYSNLKASKSASKLKNVTWTSRTIRIYQTKSHVALFTLLCWVEAVAPTKAAGDDREPRVFLLHFQPV